MGFRESLNGVETTRGGTYIMNNESFGRMMLSEQLRPTLTRVAKQIQIAAKATTKRSAEKTAQAGDDLTHLADAYEVERGPIVVIMGQTGEPGPRITMRVVNRKRYAAAREFGTRGRKGTRDLRRAGAMFGDLAGEP